MKMSFRNNRSHLKRLLLILIIGAAVFSGCFRYSFTGTSLPDDVSSIYIPFFPDQSNSGLGNLSDLLNDALINRFVNQSRLQLANDEAGADVLLEGSITNYSNKPFSVGGDEEAELNQVSITVRATYSYTNESDARWSQTFRGTAEYDPAENPIQGEADAAGLALEQVANNMFTESVGKW